MTKKVVTVDPNRKVLDALQTMARKGIGSLVVVENETPVGMITERDIIRRLARRRDTLDKKVSSIMSKPLIYVSPETSVLDSIRIMKKNNIRRLPVVGGSRLKGLITIHSDLLYWALGFPQSFLTRKKSCGPRCL